jgi:Predicted membrane protein
MKEKLILFIKGLIIGVGKVIPGVSGSVLAIMLGVYETGVKALGEFNKERKKNLIFLINVGIGIFFSMVLGSKVILTLLNSFYLSIMLLFCGLISGTIPHFKLENRNKKIINYFVTVVIFIIFTFLINANSSNVYNFNYDFKNFLFLILVGIIEAATMIIPGISGTAILMLMGVYPLVLSVFGNLWNFEFIKYNLFIIVPFFVGIIIGFVLFTKLVYFLMKKHNEKTHYVILGFIYSSLFLLLKKAFVNKFSIYELLVGIVLFLIGFYISWKFERIK